ncbi:MAG TPA: hypothetical protein DIC23_17480 [Planctomycetaceae bacterium]|jgi:hypothetical protein|nr:hypothetical protein [Planctomycetaceae bacterium]|tara:strand:+ start:2161 stop:2826 length:666 start_codon:yes stop_codon:yes gene_type:complete
MRPSRIILGIMAFSLSTLPQPSDAPAADNNKDVKASIGRVLKAMGGEQKLLNVFRFSERVLIVSTPVPPTTDKTTANRTSVVQTGGGWWIGANKRNKDKVRVLLWAWSLRILVDKTSKVTAIPGVVIDKKPTFGLRVSGSVKEPVDLYFDKTSQRLIAFDYTDTRHVVSSWKTTQEGHQYASHVAGYKFADRKLGTIQKEQWYQTDILDLVPLKALPGNLK